MSEAHSVGASRRGRKSNLYPLDNTLLSASVTGSILLPVSEEEVQDAADFENPSAYPPSIQAGIPKLGKTPKNWARLPLGELLQVVERPANLQDTQTYQLVTAKRNRGGIVAREILRGNQIRTKTQFYVETGDFLISNRQISHGACGIVPASLNGALVSNEYTVFHTNGSIHPQFLSALSHSIYFQQTCFHSSVGVHVEKLVFRLGDWMNWEFDIPPIKEQERIVGVLNAWDEAIDAVEQLIAAMRMRKIALSQRLFDNLPKAPLLDAVTVWFSGVDKLTTVGETPVLLCNYMDVFHNSRITSKLNFMHATASRIEIENNRLHKNDVVFTKDSETSEEIAQSALIAEEIEDLICGYHLAIARPRAGVGLGPFIAHVLRHPRIHWQFCRLANGVVRFGLTLDAIEEVEVYLPNLQVQSRIAAILDAEDAAIEGLAQKEARLRKQKRGLMQKMFSGISQ